MLTIIGTSIVWRSPGSRDTTRHMEEFANCPFAPNDKFIGIDVPFSVFSNGMS